MDLLNEHLVLHVAEFIKDRLYFATLKTCRPRSISNVHFFSIDSELEYESFYSDFGPLNMAMLYRYCCLLNRKLKTISPTTRIVHYTTQDFKKRVNAAFLIGCFGIIYLKKSPKEVYLPLVSNKSPLFVPFRDASFSPCSYNLMLADCFYAMDKAVTHKFLDFENFDVEEYEYYEKVENGDLNWIVPNKFIAFCGPHSDSRRENGYHRHSPEDYFEHFRKCNVTTIIRLNKKIYDAQRFKDNGFDHHDLFFVDGSAPTDAIMLNFLEIAEKAKGAIAVHCKAGLGRTGTLIACYIMKHYRFTAAEAIAWIRICRPGSIIGHQQLWLESKEPEIFFHGSMFRMENSNKVDNNNIEDNKIKNSRASRSRKDTKLSTVVAKIDHIQLNDKCTTTDSTNRSRKGRVTRSKGPQLKNSNDNDNNNNNEGENLTQGDELNRIKARRQPRSHTTGGLDLDHLKPHQRSSSQPFKSQTSGISALHSAYVSPQKPLRSSIGLQQSSSHSCHTSPTSTNATRPTRKNSSASSPVKRQSWRHLVVSPQHVFPMSQHQLKLGLSSLESSLHKTTTNNNNVSPPSTSPSHSTNLNALSSYMNLRTRTMSTNSSNADTLRHLSAPHLSNNNNSGIPERTSPRHNKLSQPR